MKCIIVGFLTIFSCSVFSSECPPPPAACCTPVPPAWHLGTPLDVSAFKIGAGGDDEVTAFIKSIPPGEKVVPYSVTININGHAEGGFGYALVRGGCLIRSVETLML